MLETDKSTSAFARLVSPDAPLDRIYHGLYFGEGPLWNRRDGTFLWVDIVGDTIHRWKEGSGAEVFIRPSTKANGLTFDKQGRLCVAGWASRSVWRVEPDGKVTTHASHFEGKRINSPNDIVVRSDGAIYFTDSPGALYNVGMADGMKVDREGNVYCTGPGGIHVIDPKGKLLGRIRIPDHCTNMAWGDTDWRSLYITTYTSVFRTRVNVPGVPVW